MEDKKLDKKNFEEEALKEYKEILAHEGPLQPNIDGSPNLEYFEEETNQEEKN